MEEKRSEGLDVTNEINWYGLRVERIIPLFREIERLDLLHNVQEKEQTIRKVYQFYTKHKEDVLFNVGEAIRERIYTSILIENIEERDKDTLSSSDIEKLESLRSDLEELSHFENHYNEVCITIYRAYLNLTQYDDSTDNQDTTCSVSTNDTMHHDISTQQQQHDHF
mgnify:CR=1 FL=1